MEAFSGSAGGWDALETCEIYQGQKERKDRVQRIRRIRKESGARGVGDGEQSERTSLCAGVSGVDPPQWPGHLAGLPRRRWCTSCFFLQAIYIVCALFLELASFELACAGVKIHPLLCGTASSEPLPSTDLFRPPLSSVCVSIEGAQVHSYFLGWKTLFRLAERPYLGMNKYQIFADKRSVGFPNVLLAQMEYERSMTTGSPTIVFFPIVLQLECALIIFLLYLST